MTTLEVLYAARERLSNDRTEFYFSDWTSCTCGHIYAAAYRRRATNEDLVCGGGERTRYAGVIRETAFALGFNGLGPFSVTMNATAYISDLTQDERDPGKPIERKHALAVVNKAIEALEAEHEANRLKVLDISHDGVLAA